MTVVAVRNTAVDADLARREAIIKVGLRTFLTVGRELMVIQAQRLYYQDYSNFEDYCWATFDFSPSRAYRLMDAAHTVDALSPNGDTPLPATESQARELTGLEPKVAAEVMVKAHEDTGGKVTAAAISEARDEVAPKPPVPATGEAPPKTEAPPAPKAKRKPREPFTQTAEEARIIGNEVWSRSLAKCVWLLAGYGIHPAAPQLAGWVAAEDIYAEPTNPARLRQAATYLTDLADAWETRPHE